MTNGSDGDDVGGRATRSDCDTCPGPHLPGRTPLGLIQDRRGRASGRALLTSDRSPSSGALGPSGRGRWPRGRTGSLLPPPLAGPCRVPPGAGWVAQAGWAPAPMFFAVCGIFTTSSGHLYQAPAQVWQQERLCVKWGQWQSAYLAVTFHGPECPQA